MKSKIDIGADYVTVTTNQMISTWRRGTDEAICYHITMLKQEIELLQHALRVLHGLYAGDGATNSEVELLNETLIAEGLDDMDAVWREMNDE